jgi:hypothetical protein
MKRRLAALRLRNAPYVIRIPNAETKGKAAAKRWHKVKPGDRAWTDCNIWIEERWERTAMEPPQDAVLCKWCFPN